jgi:hypothetical protein
VAVVHNKLKPKLAELPADITYMAAEDVPNLWNCYPWDAAAYQHTIKEHEELARVCARGGGGGGDRAAVTAGLAGLCVGAACTALMMLGARSLGGRRLTS